MTKIRIISDLHYTCGINGPDYNGLVQDSNLYHKYYQEWQKEKDCVTLIAGDICEGIENHKEFLETFFKDQKVIFIDGNHVIYFTNKDGSKPILADVKHKLEEEFPITHMFWHYLNNKWMWIPGCEGKVAIIGSTLYTDYEYCDMTLEEVNKKAKAYYTWYQFYGFKEAEFEPYKKLTKTIIKQETMAEANMRLNDFKWGKQNNSTYLNPYYYLQLHRGAKVDIQNCYDQITKINPDAKIILMTHHCLSPKCIAEKYKKGLMNASYTSNLERWVTRLMPNIRLVISGHVHNRCDFTFGKNKVHYVINPCGYIPYGEDENEPKFNPNFIINTDTL